MIKIEYGTIEYLEGTYRTQEVVKDFAPSYFTERPSIIIFKIVRTPSYDRMVCPKPLRFVGEDYKHMLYICIGFKYKRYFYNVGPFSDDQDGLDKSIDAAIKFMFIYSTHKNESPKRWPIKWKF